MEEINKWEYFPDIYFLPGKGTYEDVNTLTLTKNVNVTAELGTTNRTGTTVTFKPMDSIFKGANFSFTTVCERMQESAFLISGLTIEVEDSINTGVNMVYPCNEIKKIAWNVLQNFDHATILREDDPILPVLLEVYEKQGRDKRKLC